VVPKRVDTADVDDVTRVVIDLSAANAVTQHGVPLEGFSV
jgi:hypothetical protein